MRAVAILVALSGCIYFDSDDSGEGRPQPPPVVDDDLPPGIWEPAPGAWVYAASVAADRGQLWWATGRRVYPEVGEYLYEDDVWLHATDWTGEELVAATEIAPDTDANFDPEVVVTPSAVIARASGPTTLLHRFTHYGYPMGAPYEIAIQKNGTQLNENDVQLVATSDGRAQLVATIGYETDVTSEVAIVDLDVDGKPVSTTFAGTRDTVEPGGTQASAIAAASRPDGSTLVAWDRYYNGCISDKPSQTFTTAIADASVGPIAQVQNTMFGEFRPAIATRDTGAYITWQTAGGTEATGVIALARASDVTTVAAQVGAIASFRSPHAIALSTSNRGALAYVASDDTLHVVPFADVDGTIMLGEPRVVRAVGTRGISTVVGLVHVVDNRFVLAWIEAGSYVISQERDRLFATELDLWPALRPAPPLLPAAAEIPSRLRCP